MSLASPFVIGLIPLVFVLVWWTFRPMRAADGAYAHIRRLWADRRGLSDSSAGRRRRARGVLLGLGAALALFALARPQWGEIRETTFEQSREVLIALDLSRSMLADDVSPSRLARSKLLIESLLDQLRGERVGLAVFAGTSFLQSPLSPDYEVLRDLLRQLDPSYLPQGGSSYSAMLRTAVQAFGQRGDGDRFLVVLSDGEAHDQEWKSMLPTLSQQGIRVVALGVGTADGALVPAAGGGIAKDDRGAAVLSRLEPRTLEELAGATGGLYRDAAAWVDIAALVDATVEKGRAGRYVEQSNLRLGDRFAWFLAPAVALLLLALWLELPVLPVPRRLRRPRPARARWAAAAALLLALAPAARGSTAAPELGAVASPTAELEAVVNDLSARPTLAAADYARLAMATIDVASAPQTLRGPARLGIIGDALRAVDEGEKLDAQAAAWAELRRKLEALEKEPEPEPKQQPRQREQAAEPENDGGEGQEQQDQGGQEDAQAPPRDQPEPSARQDEQHQQAGGQAGGDDAAPAAPNEPQPGSASGSQPPGNPDSQQAAASNQPGGEEETEPAAVAAGADEESLEPEPLEDTGLGELAEPAEQTQQQPESGMRLVGGGTRRPEPLDTDNLALVEALDRMQRVEDGDAPALLFERMNRAEGVPPPPRNTRDW